MNDQTVKIFYACDDNFAKFTIVSIKSLIDNADKSKYYRIHILNSGISEENRRIATQMASDHFEIVFIDVNEYLESINDKLPLRDYYSKTTYYRMFIAEMFPEYDKALYLDSDMIILGDVSELYETDVEGFYVAACHEQVMIQVDTYGEYVEKVLGISRYNYFNAGMILINCEEFRNNKVLDKFIDLIHTYSFVVTQDEDYLNVICHNKILFLDQTWNSEVFGEMVKKEEDISIFHYIMTSKPWHYPDCRFAYHFWNYAKQTDAYDSLISMLENYTDEERRRDELVCENLLKLAEKEIARPDNYLNRMNADKGKSKDRLMVLSKIKQLEKEGRFEEDVEDDPPSKILMPDGVDYLRKSFKDKFKSKFAFFLARRFLKKILKKKQMIVKEIKGIENFRNLETGAIITCNHFNAFDSFAIQMVYEQARKKTKFYRIIKEGNYTSFPGFYGFLMRNCNTLPLSSNFDTMKEFVKCTDSLLQQGNYVLVYPEQSLWWNYRKPKPLKKGAFNFAVKNNVPVLPCFITMQDSDICDENGFFVQEYTIHVLPPIYPDPKKSNKENVESMLDKNYNDWKNVYEEFYKTPLVYAEG